MISQRIKRELEGLRKTLAPLGQSLPPLTVPLLDSIEAEAERVAALEGAATFEEPQPAQGNEHEQPRQS